jgi:hypothetical protein
MVDAAKGRNKFYMVVKQGTVIIKQLGDSTLEVIAETICGAVFRREAEEWRQ